MITIKNKKDAIMKMKELRLNYMPLDFFKTDDIAGIERFFKKHDAEEYIMRDTTKPKGMFFFVTSMEEVKKLLPKFKEEVTIAVSYRPYKEDIVLVGDIKVTRGASGDTVDITARTDTEATQRNIYDDPEYNLHASLEEDRVWRIPGFEKIMQYITEHELYNIIIEFSVYDCKIGINRENVLISEIRTEF